MKRSKSTVRFDQLSGIAVFVLLWEVLVRLFKLPSWLLPPPSRIVAALIRDGADIWPHMMTTLGEALAGFGLAILLALGLALMLDHLPPVKEAIYPLLAVSQTVPIITIAPLFVIWFGYGLFPKVLVVILTCFFPIVISLLSGLSGVDPDLINLFRTMGASKWQIFRIVKMPSTLPSLFAGLRISATYCLMAAVIGEWLGAQSGLGYYMIMAQKSFATDRVFAIITVITFLSLFLLKAVDVMERICLPWKKQVD